jgi:hypothetical protein
MEMQEKPSSHEYGGAISFISSANSLNLVNNLREMLEYLPIFFFHPSKYYHHYWICGPHDPINIGTINPMVILKSRRIRKGHG